MKPVTLIRDLLALSDDISQTAIWNWKIGSYAILQHANEGAVMLQACIYHPHKYTPPVDDHSSQTTASRSSLRTTAYSLLEPDRSTSSHSRPSSCTTQRNHHLHHTCQSPTIPSDGSTAYASPSALSSTQAQPIPPHGPLSPSSSAAKATIHGHQTSTTSSSTPSNPTRSTPPNNPPSEMKRNLPFLHTFSLHVYSTKSPASAAH
jgi:hypothetical protein